jgi:hypothetical protein
MKINLLSQPKEPLTGLETRVGVKSKSMLSPPGWLVIALVFAASAPALRAADAGEPGFVSIFNGKTLAGWDGNPKLWSVKEGAIVGQTTADNPLKGNTFLIWKGGTVGDFTLRLKFRFKALPGADAGKANSGVQYRSQVIDPAKRIVGGYQADMGDPEWWGCLYDESRRNKVLAKSNIAEVNKVLKRDGWNTYEIRCEGKHIQVTLNGHQTVDYTEPDDAIEQFGIIGLQIHGGGKAEAAYKEITLEEVP